MSGEMWKAGEKQARQGLGTQILTWATETAIFHLPPVAQRFAPQHGEVFLVASCSGVRPKAWPCLRRDSVTFSEEVTRTSGCCLHMSLSQVVVVQAISALCQKYPRKHAVLMNFLFTMLREEVRVGPLWSCELLVQRMALLPRPVSW